MFCLPTVMFYIVLSCVAFVRGWQQPDAEYSDDSLAMMPGGGWKESPDKRNTWWTKKSVHDEELASDMMKSNQEFQPIKKSIGFSMEKCMFMLIDCLRRVENKTVFLHCKDSHLSCLANCFQKYKERILFNSVTMAS